jgi:hypothetical protein
VQGKSGGFKYLIIDILSVIYSRLNFRQALHDARKTLDEGGKGGILALGGEEC